MDSDSTTSFSLSISIQRRRPQYLQPTSALGAKSVSFLPVIMQDWEVTSARFFQKSFKHFVDIW